MRVIEFDCFNVSVVIILLCNDIRYAEMNLESSHFIGLMLPSNSDKRTLLEKTKGRTKPKLSTL